MAVTATIQREEIEKAILAYRSRVQEELDQLRVLLEQHKEEKMIDEILEKFFANITVLYGLHMQLIDADTAHATISAERADHQKELLRDQYAQDVATVMQTVEQVIHT